VEQEGETFSYKNDDGVVARDLSKEWPFAPVPFCSVVITETHDNFIAARLPGNWTFHEPLSNFLNDPEDSEKARSDQPHETDIVISFDKDPAILAELTEDKCHFLEATSRTVYTAGKFGIHSKKHGDHTFPYVLINHDGISVIVYWPNNGPTAVPMLIQMAPGVQTEHDLLILGEDAVEKPFGILHRQGTQVRVVDEASTRSVGSQLVHAVEEASHEVAEEVFNLQKFIAENGVEVVVESADEESLARSESIEEAEPFAEPEPSAPVLSRSDSETVVFLEDPAVDPVVKLLVEVKSEDVSEEIAEEVVEEVEQELVNELVEEAVEEAVVKAVEEAVEEEIIEEAIAAEEQELLASEDSVVDEKQIDETDNEIDDESGEVVEEVVKSVDSVDSAEEGSTPKPDDVVKSVDEETEESEESSEEKEVANELESALEIAEDIAEADEITE